MSYSNLISRGSSVVLGLTLLLVVVSAFLLPRFGIEASADVLLDDGDPDYAYYTAMRAEWGTDEYAIFCVTRDDWFSAESVALLRGFTAVLQALPQVREVKSIATLPLLRNRAGILGMPRPITIVEEGCDLEKARAELTGHLIAGGNLISRSGRDLAVLALLDVPASLQETEPRRNLLLSQPGTPGIERELEDLEPRYRAAVAETDLRRLALVDGCRRIAREWREKFAEPVRLSGLPIININLVEEVRHDLAIFGSIAAALFMLVFFVIYRRPGLVLPAIAASLLPTLFTLALMCALGLKVTVITSNLPVLLFVLTLPFAVYLIERMRERGTGDPAEAARDIWRPCLYSALTIIAGFVSLVTSGVLPIRVFGWMGALGAALALAAIFLVLAALYRLRPRAASAAPASAGVLAPLRPLVHLSTRRPRLVILSGAVLFAVSAWGATKISAETKFIDYFRSSSEIYRGLEHIDTRMGGTTPLEIVLEGPGPGYFKGADGLYLLKFAHQFFGTVPETGNIRSLDTILDEAQKALPGLKPENVFKLLERFAAKDLREYVNADYSRTRILVRMRETAPTLNRKAILDRLNAELIGRPAYAHLKEKRATGVFVLYSNMLQSLIRSHRETLAAVVIAIYVMLLFLFRSPLLAAIVLVPQLLPVAAVLGVMGFAGIPLDLATAMIASVAMGIGIDAAIQYAVRYRIELAATRDAAEAVRRSHATIGRAIFIATGTMVAGFFVLVFSSFVPTAWFGLFTGLAMLCGLFGSLTILPALFVALKYPRA